MPNTRFVFGGVGGMARNSRLKDITSLGPYESTESMSTRNSYVFLRGTVRIFLCMPAGYGDGRPPIATHSGFLL